MNTQERRAMMKRMHELFAQAYHDAMNAVEDSGVCFISLSGNKVTVKNGRRTEHCPGEPIYLGTDDEGFACYWLPESLRR